MLSAEWVLAGFVATLLLAPRRQHANALLLAASLTLPLHLLPSGDNTVCHQDKVLALECKAFSCYDAGRDNDALKILQEIQKFDPMNATAQYVAGLVALRNGNNGMPMIHEAARRGSGLAQSYLITLTGDCPCRPIASSGGMVPPGN